jgi:hypothetical protein
MEVEQQAMTPLVSRGVGALNDMAAVFLWVSTTWTTSFSLVQFVQLSGGG